MALDRFVSRSGLRLGLMFLYPILVALRSMIDSTIFKYGLAVVAVAVAVGLRLVFNPFIGPEAPFLTFFFAVMVAAWHGGFGPGLAAALLSTAAANYFFIEPVYAFHLHPGDAVALFLFLTEVVGIGLLSGALQRSKRQAELTAHEFQRLLQSMEVHLTHTPLGVIEWDAEFRITRWAGEAERIFGWTADDMLGRQLGTFRWVHEDDTAQVEAAAGRLRTEPRVVSQHRNYDKWGGVHYCEWYSSTVRKDGRMESVLSLVLDVTKRHRADQAFKALVSGTASSFGEAFFPVFVRELAGALEMKVAMLTELVPDRPDRLRTLAMWIGDRPGPQSEYSIIGTPCEVVLREGTASFPAKLREAFPLDPDVLSMGVDSYVGKALYTGTGRLLGHVCVLDDKPLQSESEALSILSIFASRATAELERLQAQAVIMESQERLKIASDIAGLSPFEWNPHTGRMVFDQQLKKIWGVPADAPMDQQAFLAAIHPQDREAVEAGLARAIDDKGEGWFAAEFRVVNEREQIERWVSAMGRTHFDEERAVQFVGAALDVTARKHGEEQLRWWSAALERRVEERTRELRESQDRLRALATELTVTEQRERDRLAGDLHDYLAQLLVLGRLKVGQARRAGMPEEPLELIVETEEVLKQALTYTRTLVADLSPPVLREAGLEAGLQWLGHYMERFGLTVQISGEGGMVDLPGDRAVLIFNSIRELLMNVVKHGKAQEARVIVRREARDLRFVVQDDGCGFEPARMQQTGSQGFGLVSIRERMHALGGRFIMESAPGRGTSVTLMIPLGGEAVKTLPGKRDALTDGAVSCQSDETSLSRSGSHVGNATGMTHHGSRPTIRVLLVDDHAMFRQGLRSLVEGYPLVEVVGEGGNGLEALTLAGQLRPDVVVMDINMPLMDGIEATKGLKARHPEIVVIGLSLHLSSEMDQRMREAGASAYLTKESAIEQLYDAMMTALALPGATDRRS